MKRILLLPIIFISLLQQPFAQPCKISVDALVGNYDGACVNGKAEGKGTATGTDSYTGDFKNGYPDGVGKYTWKNGDWYDGSWKKGKIEGEGTFSKSRNKNDSSYILTGFWEKGKYIGKYEKPYVVRALTSAINNISVKKGDADQLNIVLRVKGITGGASDINNPVIAKVKLVGMEISEGRYEQQVVDESSSRISNLYTFRRVTYPFYAILTFERSEADHFSNGGWQPGSEKITVEILEAATWFIEVTIDK